MGGHIVNDYQGMMFHRHINHANETNTSSSNKLASGIRINSAGDDAAGLMISNRLISQSRGYDVSMRNINDGISILQTADGAIEESVEILHRMRDLALQAANGSNETKEREALQQEVVALQDELTRIAETTSFGGQKLLNGEFGTRSIQIGAESGEAMQLSLGSIRPDQDEFGGTLFVAKNSMPDNWVVPDGNNYIRLWLENDSQLSEHFELYGKEGDDLQELATRLNSFNGQGTGSLSEDAFRFSVGDDNTLQLFVSEEWRNNNVPIGHNDDTWIYDGDDGSQTLVDILGIKNHTDGDTLNPPNNRKNVTVDDIDLTTISGAQAAVSVIDVAARRLNEQRSEIGAMHSKLEHSLNNLGKNNESIAAANSRIQDTDFGKETVRFTKSSMLQNAGMSMLSQAKSISQSYLQLLR
ncbi:flagellin B [Veronia nyctiphanis]|uniref:Flagellin n=1 Tax=Veronia nyctiphanis TaxID=1278244 RepID=A0A4Q0YMA4_9GAMM|nr:flagellin [Veronia nyctiphanis]RXJ71972.1 flagellin B [Veronia nyctiphanis]